MVEFNTFRKQTHADTEVRSTAIKIVIEDRIADRREMDSDLMSPARIQTAFQDRIILRFVAGDTPHLGQGILTAFMDDPLVGIVTVFADGLVDGQALSRFHPSFDEGQIIPSDLFVCQQLIQQRLKDDGLGEDDQTAGLSVQSVDRICCDIFVVTIAGFQHLTQGHFLISVGVHQHILGLVDDRKKLVLIDDIRLVADLLIFIGLRIDAEIQMKSGDIILPFDGIAVQQDLLVLYQQVLDLFGWNIVIEKLLNRGNEKRSDIDV